MARVKSLLGIFLLTALTACGGGGSNASVDASVATTPVVASSPIGASPTIAMPAVALHIIAYGQSLSLGERAVNGWPNDLSIPNDYVDVGQMFSDGVLSKGTGPLRTFKESNAAIDGGLWGISTPGETPFYGALLALKDLPGYRIGSAAGQGATAIAGLGKASVRTLAC